ncbi:oxalurate catabolism protein HpxZ [Pseudomonas sp. LS-2]|nr:oxalurate catabolism protein HpxZ [Pseudomonas sp. LS-2]
MQVNQADAWASLNQAFERYEAALVSNDLAVLDELFWQSPHTVRYGPTEHLYGTQQIQVFRQQRPSTGLQRRICERSLTSFGTDAAVAHMVFHRDGVQRAGRQTQTWMRLDGQWRIVSAHVSWGDL